MLKKDTQSAQSAAAKYHSNNNKNKMKMKINQNQKMEMEMQKKIHQLKMLPKHLLHLVSPPNKNLNKKKKTNIRLIANGILIIGIYSGLILACHLNFFQV